MALAIGVVTVFAGSALAGHLASGVTSYTGCLVSKDGVIIKIKAGESPSSPCSGGMVQVHFSGGDITKISVTGALTGGGDNGEVTIGLKPEFTLPTGCLTGRVAEWNGSAWICGIDNDTTYSAGTGLDLNGNEFSIDESYRLPSSAVAGDSIIKSSGGTWVPQRYAKASQSCGTGQFVEGVTSTGGLDCGAPAATGGVHGYHVRVGAFDLGGTENVLTLNLPPGKYLLWASVDAINLDLDSESQAWCTLADDFRQVDVAPRHAFGGTNQASFTAYADHAGGPLSLVCQEQLADIDFLEATMSAIKIDTLN